MNFINHKNRIISIALACLLGMVGADLAKADQINVVASITPVHGLLSQVMAGTGQTPELLMRANVSPHGFALKPSQAGMLATADVVFWIGSTMETSLVKAIPAIAGKAVSIPFMEQEGIRLMPIRALDHDDEHDHEGTMDPHVWLSPENAVVMAEIMTETLSKLSPENAHIYQANMQKISKNMGVLVASFRDQLDVNQNSAYVNMHDAYQYFEDYFGLSPQAIVSLGEGQQAGARHIAQLQKVMRSEKVSCVLVSPQTESKRILSMLDVGEISVVALDPLGIDIPLGHEFYTNLLTKMTTDMIRCFD